MPSAGAVCPPRPAPELPWRRGGRARRRPHGADRYSPYVPSGRLRGAQHPADGWHGRGRLAPPLRRPLKGVAKATATPQIPASVFFSPRLTAVRPDNGGGTSGGFRTHVRLISGSAKHLGLHSGGSGAALGTAGHLGAGARLCATAADPWPGNAR